MWFSVKAHAVGRHRELPHACLPYFHFSTAAQNDCGVLSPPTGGESGAIIATIVEKFIEAGISNITRNTEGEACQTTGRTAFGLAAYATSRRRVLPTGAVAMSIPLNRQVTDPETGEIAATVEWVQVVFPHAIEIGVGDHVMAIGRWAAGKQRGVAPDGTALFWNDSLYVSEWAVTGKAEYQRLASERVAQATVVEVEDIPMFAPPTGEEPRAAVRSTRGKGRKAEDVLGSIEDI